MKNIEQMPNAQDAKNEIQEIREYFFVRAVNESIIDDFVEDLENIISDDEFIKNVLDTINGYTIDEQKQILALPKSIREKHFRTKRNQFRCKSRCENLFYERTNCKICKRV